MITHPAATACYGLVNHLHARCMSFRLPSSTPGPCYYSLLQPVHTPACAVYVLPAAQQHRAHRAAQALAEADRDGVKQGAQGGRGVASGHHLQPQPQGCGVQGLTLYTWCQTRRPGGQGCRQRTPPAATATGLWGPGFNPLYMVLDSLVALGCIML